MTVADNRPFADADNLVVGSPQGPQTESVLINGAVTAGSSITVANTLKFAHELNCPVTLVWERQITLYGSSSDGGSLTSIATFDIQWGKPYSEYTLKTTDTAYAYYVAKFYDGTTLSSASDYVIAAGVAYDTVQPFITQALDITNSKLDENYLTRDQMVRWANDCQSAITQFTYQDPLTNQFMRKDWGFEVIEDSSSITLTQNENSYALSALTNAPKYPNSVRGFIDLRIGTQVPLSQVSIQDYDNWMFGKARTTVATQASAGDTTLVVASAAELNSGGGTVYVGADTVTYTGISTNTLTGIPASGTGSITETQTVGTVVWQNVAPGLPKSYTIFNGNILLDYPVSETYVGQKLKIRYMYAIPRLTTVAQATVIPFTNVFQYYLAAQIMGRKMKFDEHKYFMDIFNKQVLANALSDMIPTPDGYTYYNFEDPLTSFYQPGYYYNSQ